MSGLVLSLFPGIGLVDMAFELETCDHDKDKALHNPPGGSWRVEQDGTRQKVACHCGRFFGYLQVVKERKRKQ